MRSIVRVDHQDVETGLPIDSKGVTVLELGVGDEFQRSKVTFDRKLSMTFVTEKIV